MVGMESVTVVVKHVASVSTCESVCGFESRRFRVHKKVYPSGQRGRFQAPMRKLRGFESHYFQMVVCSELVKGEGLKISCVHASWVRIPPLPFFASVTDSGQKAFCPESEAFGRWERGECHRVGRGHISCKSA